MNFKLVTYISTGVSSQFSQRWVIPVWPWNQPTNKIHISAYTYPTHLIFGMGKDAANIYYCTKNQVCGLEWLIFGWTGNSHRYRCKLPVWNFKLVTYISTDVSYQFVKLVTYRAPKIIGNVWKNVWKFHKVGLRL